MEFRNGVESSNSYRRQTTQQSSNSVAGGDHSPKASSKEKRLIASGGAGGDNEFADEKRDAPVLMALLVTFGWMAFAAAVFCLWEEEWTYFTSLYFFFISMSTIGFGDVSENKNIFVIFVLMI